MGLLLNNPRKPCWPYVLNRGAPITRGLVAWWPGDPPNTTRLQDNSRRRRYHLTFTNGPTLTRGFDGGTAVRYVRASSHHMTGSFAPVVDMPFTVVAWCNSNDAAVSQDVVELHNAAVTGHNYRLNLSTVSTVRAIINDNTSNAIAASGAGWATNRWFLAGAVFRTVTSRTAYFNGVAGTENTDSRSPTGIDTTFLGRVPVFDNYMSGLIGDVMIWSRALTDIEMFSLYQPSTRWQLRYQPGRIKYFLQSSAATYAYPVVRAASAGIHQKVFRTPVVRGVEQ